MSNVRRLDQIRAAGPLDRADELPIWQDGRTSVATLGDILDLLGSLVPYLGVAADGTVTVAGTKIGQIANGRYTAFADSLALGSGTVTRTFSGPFPMDTRTYLDPQKTNGPYTNYATAGTGYEAITNTEEAANTGDGQMRDGRVLILYDRDAKNYEASGYRAITNAMRVTISGQFDNGVATKQWKDLHGAWFTSIGRSGGIDRGTSGILAESVQLGTGVATNEFSAGNPSYAVEEANLLAPVISIVYNHKANVSGTRRAYGVAASLTGFLSTAAFRAASVSAVGQPGQARYGVQLDELTVTQAAITMPQGTAASPNAGTLIEYKPAVSGGAGASYSIYDRANDAYTWVVNGNVVATISAGRLVFATGAVSTFANDAAADAGGVVSGQIYRIGRTLQMRP